MMASQNKNRQKSLVLTDVAKILSHPRNYTHWGQIRRRGHSHRRSASFFQRNEQQAFAWYDYTGYTLIKLSSKVAPTGRSENSWLLSQCRVSGLFLNTIISTTAPPSPPSSPPQLQMKHLADREWLPR